MLLEADARTRVKTKWQLANEVVAIREVVKERAKRAQQQAGAANLAVNNAGELVLAPAPKLDGPINTRAVVAERSGVGQHAGDLLYHLAKTVPTLPGDQQCASPRPGAQARRL